LGSIVGDDQTNSRFPIKFKIKTAIPSTDGTLSGYIVNTGGVAQVTFNAGEQVSFVAIEASSVKEEETPSKSIGIVVSNWCYNDGNYNWKEQITTMNQQQMDDFLRSVIDGKESPLRSNIDTIMDYINDAGMDPAFVMELWRVETQCGLAGNGTTDKNIGNMRATGDSGEIKDKNGNVIGTWTNDNGWRKYDSYDAAIADWFDNVKNNYLPPDKNIDTYSDFLNKYAPSSENVTQDYINMIMDFMNQYDTNNKIKNCGE